MTTITAARLRRTGSTRHGADVSGVRGCLRLAGALLAGVLAAELVIPEADPDAVRRLLVELGRLDPAGSAAERIEALRAYQRSRGLPADGVADVPTVTALTRDAADVRERRALGL